LSAPASQRLPYPGLRSFRRDESDLFFGREDCVNGMVDRLGAIRFLAVLGSSGAGKSSVVKTGLLDGLDLGLMASANSTWRVVDFKPGGAPLRNLAQRLLETRDQGMRDVSDDDVALLRAFLLRGPLSVAEWCGDGHLPPATNLLVLVDQFEELFRYQDYAGREEAEAFAALLLESARQKKFPIYVALTMRSEYLGACALVDGLAEAISAGMYLIPRMGREQCRAAIAGPATVCNFKIEDALTNRLLNDLAAFAPWDDRSNHSQLDRLGRRADQLPLLQYCLNRMWMRARDGAGDAPIILTLADYERIGGLKGALDAHASEILRDLGDGRRLVAEAVFRALTEGSGASDAVRHPTRFGDLVDICNGDEAGVRAVVDAFRASDCNFLAPELNPANPRPLTSDNIVDISHESLIRQWKQLAEWVETEARARRQWRRLQDRFEDGQPMLGAELANMQAWRDEQHPNAAWAKRYGGDYQALIKFIETSEEFDDRQRRKPAPMIMPLIGCGAAIVSLVCAWGTVFAAYRLKGLPAPSATPWYTGASAMAVTLAITCGFGLWRYSGIGRARSLLAGGSIVIWGGLGVILIEMLVTPERYQIAQLDWNLTFAAAVTVTIMAYFYAGFRSLYVWIVLVGTYSVFDGLVGFDSSLSDNDKGLFFLIGWMIWCVVFGFQLRKTVAASAEGERRKIFGAIKMTMLAFLALGISEMANKAVMQFAYGTSRPSWWWIVETGGASLALGAVITFGLQRYRGVPIKKAVLAGASYCVLQFAAAIAFVMILMSHNMSSTEGGNWVVVVLMAPCILAMFTAFDSALRNVLAWLLFVPLLVIPEFALVWSHQSGVLKIEQASLSTFIEIIGLLWIGALGYWLQSEPRLASGVDKSHAAAPAPPLTGKPTPSLSRA
jgi:hypothetical protein